MNVKLVRMYPELANEEKQPVMGFDGHNSEYGEDESFEIEPLGKCPECNEIIWDEKAESCMSFGPCSIHRE